MAACQRRMNVTLRNNVSVSNVDVRQKQQVLVSLFLLMMRAVSDGCYHRRCRHHEKNMVPSTFLREKPGFVS